MKIKRGHLYLADLSPQIGSEPGKARPVLVIQSDKLNGVGHSSTWILPCTTQLTGANILRVTLPKGLAKNVRACEIMIDQSRAIDNRRFVRELGPVPPQIVKEIEQKIRLCGDL